jgi:hypothetical protein
VGVYLEAVSVSCRHRVSVLASVDHFRRILHLILQFFFFSTA